MMTEGSEPARPHGREHESAPEDQSRSPDELDRDAQSSGGDADAAGSVEEREAVAADEDDTWENDD
jgi:hypothetical protein